MTTQDAKEAAERLRHDLSEWADLIATDRPFNPPSNAAIVNSIRHAIDLLTLLSARQGEDGWQPIETAPKNKTIVALLHRKGTYARYGVGWYMPLSGWQGWAVDVAPTHWRPLPPPPSPSGEGEIDE